MSYIATITTQKDACLYGHRTKQAHGIASDTKRNISQLFRSTRNVHCLKRHEINANYYAIKKIRSKIKTDDLALKGKTRRLETLRAFFQIFGQPVSSFCVQQK